MANPKSTKAWFGKANTDLRAGKYLLSAGDQFWSQVLFQCQQSVEKSIKGYLTFHSVKFPKTHVIKELLKAVSKIDPDLSIQLKACKKLSKYAVAHRYPGAGGGPLTKKKIDEAIKVAESTYDELSKLSGI